MAFSPDGTRIVTGAGHDTTIRIWDSSSFACLASLKGHRSSSVVSVVFSSDGTRIVSGSDDGIVRLWDAATGALLRTFEGHTEYVYVAIARNGRHIVSGGSDRVVIVWDSETGTLIRKCVGHSKAVYGVAIDPADRRIVSGSDDETVRIWDLASGKPLVTCKAYASVWSISVGVDFAVGGLANGTVALWDTATGYQKLFFNAHKGGVIRVACSVDGQRILTCCTSDNLACVWTADGTLFACLCGPAGSDGCGAIALSPDGKCIATGHDQGIISIRNNVLPPLAPSVSSLSAPVPSGSELDLPTISSAFSSESELTMPSVSSAAVHSPSTSSSPPPPQSSASQPLPSSSAPTAFSLSGVPASSGEGTSSCALCSRTCSRSAECPCCCCACALLCSALMDPYLRFLHSRQFSRTDGFSRTPN